MEHFRQILISDKFARFKLPTQQENLVKYNQVEPPEFNMSRIRDLDITLVCGQSDLLSSPGDYQSLAQQLALENRVELHEFPHGHLGLLMPANPKQPTVIVLSVIVSDY